MNRVKHPDKYFYINKIESAHTFRCRVIFLRRTGGEYCCGTDTTDEKYVALMYEPCGSESRKILDRDSLFLIIIIPGRFISRRVVSVGLNILSSSSQHSGSLAGQNFRTKPI